MSSITAAPSTMGEVQTTVMKKALNAQEENITRVLDSAQQQQTQQKNQQEVQQKVAQTTGVGQSLNLFA